MIGRGHLSWINFLAAGLLRTPQATRLANNPPQEQRVSNKVAADFGGLLSEDPEPLETAASQPPRRPAESACPVLKQAANPETDRDGKLLPMPVDPLLLQRIAHPDQE